MHITKTLAAAAAFTLTALAGPAMAATLSFGPLTDNSNPSGAISTSLAISTAATNMTSMQLTYQGDFGQAGESMEIFIEGISIGTVGPNAASTGSFGSPSFLNPALTNGNLDAQTATATLNLDISSFVGDGFLDVSFVPASNVNFLPVTGQGPFAGLGTFGYGVAGTLDVSVVPLPASLPLLGGGVLLLGALKRRKRRRA